MEGGDDDNASRVFDRAWAASLLEQARALQATRAAAEQDGTLTRIEILRLRFEEGLPVREIARRLRRDPAKVHYEYAKARREFRQALIDVVQEHEPMPIRDAEAECARLVLLLRPRT